MLCIGQYYTDSAVYNLYKAPRMMNGWVTNLCYYDIANHQYYSPTLAKIAEQGRDHNGQRHPEFWWAQYISDAHSSFVLIP